MVVRFNAITIVATFFAATVSAGETPDLSDADPATLHRYVGHFVRITGRVSLTGTYGPHIDIGKTQISLLPALFGSLDTSLAKQPVVVIGTLYFQPGLKSVPGFFFFGNDCTLHYSSPWPREPSNRSMQLTPSRTAFTFCHD
jgi:hypothetical protein